MDRKDIEAVFPATPAQQGMLFHVLHAPGTGVYHSQFRCELDGDLDVDAFERAWQWVADRHASLRSAFATTGPVPVQIVARRARVPFERLDWSDLAQDARSQRMDALLRADRARGFALHRAPLMRVFVARLSSRRHALLWSHHHALLDGWSMTLVLRELFFAYASLRTGTSPVVPPAPSFGDYAAWLGTRDAAVDTAFWHTKLGDVTAPTPLPVSTRTGPPGPVGHRLRRMALGAVETAALQSLARRTRVTLNTVVTAAYATVLAQHGGTRDVVFGATVAGRPADLPGVESMVGLFINTVPTRVVLREDEPADATLARLQRESTVQRAFEHAPLADIRRASGVPGGTSLFDALLVFENQPTDTAAPSDAPGGLRVRDVHLDDLTSYPLALTVAPGAELGLRLTYATARYDDDDAARILSHVRIALTTLANQPTRPLTRLSLLDADARRRVLYEWNDTRVDGLGEACLHTLIEAQVARTPEAIAVEAEATRVTYAELESRANRLANVLHEVGARRGTRVGVCLERSIDLVVTLYAVLKTGAAYVPIEPDLPIARRAYVLGDADPRVLVTTRALADALPALRATVVPLDDPDFATRVSNARSDRAPTHEVTPADVAYVIYTSGSSGQPKGALNAHGAVVNRLRWAQATMALDASDAVLQKTPSGFDVSVQEFFWPLLAGARIVVAPPGAHRDPAALAALIERTRVTTVHFVPSMLGPFLEQPGITRACASLRRVLASGEALGIDAVRRCRAHLPDATLINLYGPTEAAIDVTAWRCRDDDVAHGSVPIGRPVANTRVYVLDPHLEPVAIGVAGELWIAGVQVGRGYLHRPALTAARFVPDAFGNEPGARMYRTGDIARFRRDGALDYLGRVDHQVKLRGVRIEPGEIEAALTALPGVLETVVLARDDVGPTRTLAAYLVPRAGATLDPEALGAALGEQLPAYMVPGAFVVLDAMPRMPSGKIDRRALPAPSHRVGSDASFVAPRGPVEETLARIWCEVLRVERVGADDAFFRLGGDSITSMQVVARAARAGIHLTPRQLFAHPTLSALAASAGAHASAIGLDAGPVVGEVALTPIQHAFFARERPAPHHYNQSLLLRAPAAIDPGALDTAVAALLAHHDMLRARFDRGPAGAVVQRVVPFDAAAPEARARRVDLRSATGSPATLVRAIESNALELQGSLDLANGPVFRVVHLDAGPDHEGRLFLIAHHLVMDAVSWRVLLEDLASAYDAASTGEPVRLAPRSTSFQRWAERLVAFARSPAARAEVPFWTAAAATRPAPLPRDRAHGTDTVGSARGIVRTLDITDTRALVQGVPARFGGDVLSALLVALARALAPWTGETVADVELEGHGREALFDDVDLSRTVGWFTTLRPMVVRLAPGSTTRAAVRSVRAMLGAAPAGGIGHGALRYLSPDATVRDAMARHKTPAIGVNYLGRFDSDLANARFAPAPESAGPSQSPSGPRAHEIELSAHVARDRLTVRLEHGTAVHHAATIDALADRLVEALRSIAAETTRPVDEHEIDEAEPSFAQEAFWFLAQLALEGANYTNTAALSLEGPLEAEAARRAFAEIVRRHEILRTTLEVVDGRPQQRIRPAPADFDLVHIDVSSTPEPDRLGVVRAMGAVEAAAPMPLATGPVLRARLLRFAPTRHVLLVTTHHAVADRWSIGVLVREFTALYAAFSAGQPSTLAPLPMQYRDVAEAQRSRLAADARDAGLGYWTHRLAHAPARLEIPTDLPRPEVATYRGAAEGAFVPPALLRDVRAMAAREGASLFMVLFAAYATLLHRSSGQSRVVVGTPVANRTRLEHEELIGPFANTLALDVAFDDDPTFEQVLRRVRDDSVEAFAHAEVPFARVVEALRPARSTAYAPVFQTLFVLQNTPRATLALQGLSVEQLPLDEAHSKFDLQLYLGEESDGLQLGLVYATDLFTDTTAQRLLAGYLAVLRAGVARPDVRVAALDLEADTRDPARRREDSSRRFRTTSPQPLTIPDSLRDPRPDKPR